MSDCSEHRVNNTHKISRSEYQAWLVEQTWGLLQNPRLGQNFCRDFHRQDFRILFEPCNQRAQQLIERLWIY